MASKEFRKVPKKGLNTLQTKWKIDEFLEELLDCGVDYSLSIEYTATNEVSFIIRHRKSQRDSEIVSKSLFSSFGY